MIKYIKDLDKTFEQDLIKYLREHNEKFTGKVEFKNVYAYLVEDNHLVGAIQLSYGWDWASVSKVFYLNRVVLRKLMSRVFNEIKETALGIKFFTPIKSRYDDFISIGFIHANELKNLGEYDEFYYANLSTMNKEENVDDVLLSYEPHEDYQKILDQEDKTFDKKHNIKDKQGEFMWVALDDQVCVGGVSGDYYEKTVYVSRLAVNPTYKLQGIGTKLMRMVEDDARSKGFKFIELGTTDFQARAFYEKLGYHVIHTMPNYPKGYNCYSLIKSLTDK